VRRDRDVVAGAAARDREPQLKKVLLTLTLAAALALAAGTASATHLGYKPCSDTKLPRVSVTHVQSNYGCRNARRALRTLLAHGIGRLPEPTAQAGRWGCHRTVRRFHVCERRRSDPSRAPAGIVFAARARGA